MNDSKAISFDAELSARDVQDLSSVEGVTAFFATLGYNTNGRTTQTPGNLGITAEGTTRAIRKIYQLADQEGLFKVYLFELTNVTVAHTRALARAFRTLSGNYVLVLTSDYERLDFVLVERYVPSTGNGGSNIGQKQAGVRPRTLTVDRRNPSRVQLRVLRRLTWTESDPFAQYDKLLSAYSVADWSEELFNNRALFSDYYLIERLRERPEWKDDPKPPYLALRDLYCDASSRFAGKEEKILRHDLVEPAFLALGLQGRTGKKASSSEAEPDYRLYSATLKDSPLALCLVYPWGRSLDGKDYERDTEAADENPGAVVVSLLERGEAPWAVVTNGKVWRLYSQRTHSKATNYYEIDLEEVLAATGPQADPADLFRYFWLLFRAQAFEPVEILREGKTISQSFLDQLLTESEDYAKQLGERLKGRVFEQVFPHLASGFIAYAREQNSLADISDDILQRVFQGTLTFLYRLLFLLYAESRDLLPVKEVRGYWESSLKKLKDEISNAGGTIEADVPGHVKKAYRADQYSLYDRLAKLFAVIDRGDASLNIPVYNGGLFLSQPEADDDTPEAEAARFLNSTKVADRFLARAIDLLARDEDSKRHDLVPIDYKSLGVRHLGSIYEGLLEFKVRIATEKLAVVKQKGREVYTPFKELSDRDQERAERQKRVVKKGEVYLENDKRERKATGSYYTPDYIVKYIVEQAVGPFLREKFERLRPRLREAQKWNRDMTVLARSKKEAESKYDHGAAVELKWASLVDELFDIKILDPAMGSGHFLVEAVDFITDKTLDFLNSFPWNPVRAHLIDMRETILRQMEEQNINIDEKRLTDVNLLKRHVLKRCIYGVDLNPMAVELAKVSLWLNCFTLGAPLSFLDHHLRCGNSLIGITVEEVNEAIKTGQLSLLSGTRFEGMKQAVGGMIRVGGLPDVTAAQIHESRSQYRKAINAMGPAKRLLDLYTSQWFGNSPEFTRRGRKKIERNTVMEFLRDTLSEQWAQAPTRVDLPEEWRDVALRAARSSQVTGFFHWELEFPEVFYGSSEDAPTLVMRREDGGFDAVIGNPPYANEARGHKEVFRALKPVPLRGRQYEKNMDLFNYFVYLSGEVSKQRRITALIVPQYFMDRSGASKLRRFLFATHIIRGLVDFGDYPVFREASGHHSAILVLCREVRETNQALRISYLAFDANSPLRASDWLASAEPRDCLLELSADKLILRDSDSPDLIGRIRRARHFTLPTDIVERGVDTSPSDSNGHGVFVLSESEFSEMRSTLNKREVEILKPFYRANQVFRYGYEHRNQYWLIYTDRPTRENMEEDPRRYPHLTKHLLRFSGVMTSSNKPFGLHRSKTNENFTDPNKIVWVRKTERPLFAIVPVPYFMDESVWFIHFGILAPYSGNYLLSIFNSRLFWFWCRKHKTQGSQLQIDKEIVVSFPVREISFTTNLDRRRALVTEGRSLLTSDALAENLAAFLEFVDRCLVSSPEQSDVLHDILSYLAQSMTESIADVQGGATHFVDWVSTEIQAVALRSGDTPPRLGSSMNALSDLCTRGDLPKFDDIVDWLTKSARRLGLPLDSAFRARLRTEYESSLVPLLTLRRRLVATDAVIDQMIYRLYGLTADEILLAETRERSVETARHPPWPEPAQTSPRINGLLE